MIATENLPLSFVAVTGFLLLAGILILIFGAKLSGRLRGTAYAVLLLALLGYLGNLFLLGNEGFHPVGWTRGWIWPRELPGAIKIGIVQDALGGVLAAASVFLAFVAATPSPGEKLDPAERQRLSRIDAALLIGAGSVPLAWAAQTPWLAFFGVSGAIVAGFLALAHRWENESEANTASRFFSERGFGLVLAILGACVLAGFRGAIEQGDGGALGVSAGPVWQDALGTGLLAAGLVIQMRPFPFLGSLSGQSALPLPVHALVTQIFPAWAAFGILFRFEAELRASGALGVLGWFALGTGILAALAGLFQAAYRATFGLWLASALAITAAVLAFAGPAVALPVLVCVSFGALSLAMSAAALEVGGGSSQSNRKRATAAKTIAALAVLCAVGVVGFSSSGALLTWLSGIWAKPAAAALALGSLFVSGLLGWRVFWQVARLKNATEAGWGGILASVLPILLSLGVLLDGTLSGGVVPGAPDQVLAPFLAILFPSSKPEAISLEAFPMLAAALFGGAVLAFVVALLTSGRSAKADSWQQLRTRFPRFAGFVASGYGIDAAAGKSVAVLASVFDHIEAAVGRFFWNRWIPNAFFLGLHYLSRAANAADSMAREKTRDVARRSVEVPSKVLQLVQNGDVQWYLLFGVGSGLALLGHFLKFRG